MFKDERRWHWVYTGEEFDFADDEVPFGAVQYMHNWKRKEEFAMHKHSFIEIVIVLRGKAVHIIKTRNNEINRCEISNGNIIIINPEEEHAFELSEGEELEIINLNFKSSFVDEIFKQRNTEIRLLDFIYQQPLLPLEIRFGNILKLNKVEMNFIISQTKKIEKENEKKQIGYGLFISFMMVELLMVISRKYLNAVKSGKYLGNDINKDISYVSRVKGYIEHNYMEKISKNELSRISMSSERQLSRKFKQFMGITAFEYIQKVRIDRAKKNLLETNDKIIDIATFVGFNDISYFNKIFVAHEGMSPGAFRKKYSINNADL